MWNVCHLYDVLMWGLTIKNLLNWTEPSFDIPSIFFIIKKNQGTREVESIFLRFNQCLAKVMGKGIYILE